MTSLNLKTEVLDSWQLENVAHDWKKLEKRASHRFFLSWSWMNVWLKTFDKNAYLIKVTYKDKVVGMAFVCLNKIKRRKLLSIKQSVINETGIPELDQQWIEYNGFLIDSNYESQAIGAMLSSIDKQLDWDELLLGVSSEHQIKEIEKQTTLYKHTRWETCSHGVDLAQLRHNNTDYLKSLSRNTRSQINRSIKKYTQFGEITVHHASSAAEAKSFLKALAPLHIARWGSGYQESGFANPMFCLFHENLIEEAWPKGEIDIIKVSSGNKTIGYFYNFLYQNRVYFYLSALQFETNNALKPGLMGHAICIQEYLDNNFDYYDFMGGGESYKDRLASKVDILHRVSFQKPKFNLKLERFVREVKRQISKNASG